MTRVAVPEIHPSFNWSIEGLSIPRRVISEELDVVFGRLAILSSGTRGIELPINPLKEIWPVTELVKTKEIQAHNPHLQINKHNIDGIRAELCEELPELNAPKTAIIQGFEIHKDNKYGNHYLSLLFSEESGFDLSEERADAWDVLRDIRCGNSAPLSRRAYCPDIRLARIGRDIPASVVGHIGKYITRKLGRPLEVTLAPVLESSPTFAMQSQQHIAA